MMSFAEDNFKTVKKDIKTKQERNNTEKKILNSIRPFVASTFEKLSNNEKAVTAKEQITQHEFNELDINSSINKELERLKTRQDIEKWFDKNRLTDYKNAAEFERNQKTFGSQSNNRSSFLNYDKKNISQKNSKAIKRTSVKAEPRNSLNIDFSKDNESRGR